MTIRKHLARILHKAARKLDPPPTPREMAREMTESTVKALAAMAVNEFTLDRWLPRNVPDCKIGPDGPVNTGYTPPSALVRVDRDALARMSRNQDVPPRGSTVDEVVRKVAEKIEAERRKDK